MKTVRVLVSTLLSLTLFSCGGDDSTAPQPIKPDEHSTAKPDVGSIAKPDGSTTKPIESSGSPFENKLVNSYGLDINVIKSFCDNQDGVECTIEGEDAVVNFDRQEKIICWKGSKSLGEGSVGTTYKIESSTWNISKSKIIIPKFEQAVGDFWCGGEILGISNVSLQHTPSTWLIKDGNEIDIRKDKFGPYSYSYLYTFTTPSITIDTNTISSDDFIKRIHSDLKSRAEFYLRFDTMRVDYMSHNSVELDLGHEFALSNYDATVKFISKTWM